MIRTDGLVEQVSEVRVALTRVAGLVRHVADVVADRLEAPQSQVISWLAMPGDQEQVAAVLADLTDWVARVFLRYPDGAAGLPECWLWHPEVVEELLWLRQAWQAAYTGPTAATGRVAQWHERHRPGVARRITRAAGACCLDEHLDTRRPAAANPPSAAVASIAVWWATARDQQAPPPPTPDHMTQTTTRWGGIR